jgi:hypothetical protein
LRNGAALAPRKAVIKRLPLDSAVDLEFRRPGGTTSSKIQIKRSALHPQVSGVPTIAVSAAKAATRADIGIKALAAAHAGSRGRLFEHIVRHT